VWEPDGKLVHNLGPAVDHTSRVAWTADGRSVVAGDLSGEVHVRSLVDSSSMPLPMPVGARPAALVLVAPELTPARPYIAKPAAANAKANQRDVPAARGASLEPNSALKSARLALSALEASTWYIPSRWLNLSPRA
jgi:hypothetical protein